MCVGGAWEEGEGPEGGGRRIIPGAPRSTSRRPAPASWRTASGRSSTSTRRRRCSRSACSGAGCPEGGVGGALMMVMMMMHVTQDERIRSSACQPLWRFSTAGTFTQNQELFRGTTCFNCRNQELDLALGSYPGGFSFLKDLQWAEQRPKTICSRNL